MSTVSARWVAFVERWHRAILLGSLLVAIACALSLRAMRLDLDVLGMLPTGTPPFDNFKAFVAEFGELDELVVLIQADSPAAAEDFATAFSAELSTLPSVQHVQGRIDLDAVRAGILGRYLYNYLPLEGYDALEARLTPAGIDAAVATDRAILQAPFDLTTADWIRRDPLGIVPLVGRTLVAAAGDRRLNVQGGYLQTSDGTAILLMVRPTRSAFDIAFTTAFMGAVRDREARAREATHAVVQVGYTGSYAFALEDAATIKWDIARYVFLALAGVLTVFFLGYRRLRILPFVAYPLALNTLITFALGLVLYDQLNAVSLSFAAILYGLSIDSGIYYYTRVVQERQAADLRTAIARTLAALGSANLVATTTTAAAFAVIGVSRLAAVSQLGVLTAIGMLVNFVEFFLIYPAVSFWWPRTIELPSSLDTPRLGRVAAYCARHWRWIVGTCAAVTPGLLWLAVGVPFDANLLRLRPQVGRALAVEHEIGRRFGLPADLGAVLVHAPDLESALVQSEAIAVALARYHDEGVIAGVQSGTALLPSARVQEARLARFAALPREQAAETLRGALAAHGFARGPFEPFLQDFARPHDALVRWGDPALAPFTPLLDRYTKVREGAATVATYVQPAAGVTMADVEARLRQDLPSGSFVVAARSLLEQQLGHLLQRELVWFFVGAFLLNLLLVLATFRRVGATAAILFPEALVSVVVLAGMHVLDVGVGPVNVIVVPLILGIGVDNCVYIAQRCRQGESAGAAVRYAGRALTVSALTTVVGFGFLGLSGYPALAVMGELMAASLLLCLVATLTVLPAFLALDGLASDAAEAS